MRLHKLNCYLFTLFFTLLLCIGNTYAGKLVEHDCYLSNAAGEAIDIKGKTTMSPIYMFNWEVEDDHTATIKRPFPVKDRDIYIQNGLRHINFKHSYCGKTPVSKKNVTMTDEWDLLQSSPKGEFWDLTLILDPKHNIISTKPRVATHKLFCSETLKETQGTNIHIVPNSTFSDNEGDYHEGDSGDEINSPGSVTNDDDSLDEGDGQCFEDNAAEFWAAEAIQLEKEAPELKKVGKLTTNPNANIETTSLVVTKKPSSF